MAESKRSKISELHIQEAALLKAIWNSRPHKTQAIFGEHYGLGNQANVGHYLNARSALNPKAAAAFASELGCAVSDFSPRIASELNLLAGGVDGIAHRIDVKALPGARPSLRTAIEYLAEVAAKQRPTLRKNMANLLVELMEHPDDPALVEQTVKDVERFFEK